MKPLLKLSKIRFIYLTSTPFYPGLTQKMVTNIATSGNPLKINQTRGMPTAFSMTSPISK